MEKDVSFQDVILSLNNNIFRHLHVSSCGIIKSIEKVNKINIYQVGLFPVLTKESEIVISCCALANLNLKINDVVLIIYTDRSSKSGIGELTNGSQYKNLSKLPQNGELHAYKNGIIVGKIDLGEENDE